VPFTRVWIARILSSALALAAASPNVSAEHRADGLVEPPGGGDRRGAEVAVIVDGFGDQRMRELQQDRAGPAKKQQTLGRNPL
jgi:hypothetical protein